MRGGEGERQGGTEQKRAGGRVWRREETAREREGGWEQETEVEKQKQQKKKTRGEEGQQICSLIGCKLHKLLPVREEENLMKSECINRHVTVALSKIC